MEIAMQVTLAVRNMQASHTQHTCTKSEFSVKGDMQ